MVKKALRWGRIETSRWPSLSEVSNRRRECDWDPTISEFVAIMLLGRVRLESNPRAENKREFALVVGDVSPAMGVRLGSTRT
jgi:hypothetical protein